MQVLLIPIVLIMFFCGPPKPTSPPQLQNPEESRLHSMDSMSLIKNLDSENIPLINQSILELASRKEKSIIPKLRNFLTQSKNTSLLSTSLLALGDLEDRESTQLIASFANGSQGVSQSVVVDALGRMKDPSGAKAILPLLDSPIHSLRLQVVESLSLMKASGSGEEVLNLARSNTDPEKAKTYAMALGKLQFKPAENYLMSLAENSPPSPTLAASYLALGRIQSRKAIPNLVEALGNEFEKGRENSALALIMIKDDSCLPLIYPYLKSKSSELRYLAASVIVEIPRDSSVREAAKLLEGNDSVFYGVSSYILGRMKARSFAPKIVEVLKDRNTPEREIIAQSLGWLGDRNSIPALIEVLREKEGEGRYGAAWALGILEAKEAFSDLAEATASKDYKLKNLAIESLGMLKMEEGIPVLEKLIDENKNNSIFAMKSIANIQSDRARLSLEKFAKSEDPILFHTAIEMLGKRKDETSIPFLMKLLKEDSSSKQKLIFNSLSSITGKKLYSTADWIQWYESSGK